MTLPAVSSRDETPADLLADLAGDGDKVRAWLMQAVGMGGEGAAGADYGLDPAFSQLLAALTGDSRSDDGRAFLRAVFEALPDGADTGRIVREWLLASWTDELARHLAATPAFAGATAIVDLVRASLTNAIAPKAWRAARSALSRAEGLDLDAADYAQAVLAMAWNLDEVPGAAHDVATSWARAITQASNRADGWTAALGEEFAKLRDEMHDKARAVIDPADAATVADPQAALAKYRAELERLEAESPRAVALAAENRRCWEGANKARQEWLAKARMRLTSLVSQS